MSVHLSSQKNSFVPQDAKVPRISKMIFSQHSAADNKNTNKQTSDVVVQHVFPLWLALNRIFCIESHLIKK